ncbi:MAG: WecB/TagA/CpsF family glycosyltransferase [Verrucomicrobia bacterium]|nr:WecB/TagA/CpsF family glycosyltransferase [Verrucomicrobiota bacterium]
MAVGVPRFNVLGVGIDAVNMADTIRVFASAIEGQEVPGYICPMGVAGIMEARRNPELRTILNKALLNTPDGMPLVWLGKLFGHKIIRRVYGPDVMRDVCAYSADKGWRHFLYGGGPGLAETLREELEANHPGIQICGTFCPPFRDLNEEEETGLIQKIAEQQPDILWVGVSTPRQLYFAGRMQGRLKTKVIAPVGYAFDVNAGTKIDSPEWVKNSGFQWLHRALTDPRLWKRYLQDNPRFVGEVLLQLLRIKKYPMSEK